MPFYPLFDIFENQGFIHLANFPPNNWEKVPEGEKNLFYYQTNGVNCLIGPGVMMRTANHAFSDINCLIRNQGHDPKDIIIGNNCWLGANVIVLGGVRIGEGSVIGAGSIVTKNIAPMSVAVGIPAKSIKSRN